MTSETRKLEIIVKLPDWVWRMVAQKGVLFPLVEDRMRFVIELARQNVIMKTGGPFGSAVFDAAGRLVAPGVNLVASAKCSLFHAEMVAIAMAQKKLGRYDIGDGGRGEYELASSAEPCAMCYGAVLWSGVTRLVCGARAEDAERVGFDEGEKPSDWPSAMEERGIRVLRDVLREEAAQALDNYAKTGGVIYNPGRRDQL